MDFRSDNVAGIAPEILEAIIKANEGTSAAYGDDELTKRLDGVLSDIFEHQVRAFPLATGTAANALGLSVICPPFGAIYCHPLSHVMIDECGAPEFYSGGAKLVPVDGRHGKIPAGQLDRLLAGERAGDVHHVQPAAITISQLSEAGTIYQMDEIAAIAEVARRYNLRLHMDGTRFANAAAASRAAPKDLTWKAGIDVLSLGATKNGALAAEMVVFFDSALAETFAYRRKRAGQLMSKGRFMSAQLLAYFQGGLWLRMASHANKAAARLAKGLRRTGIEIVHPVEANFVFPRLPTSVLSGLKAEGFKFYEFGGVAPVTVRLVGAFDTRMEDVEKLIASVERLKSA